MNIETCLDLLQKETADHERQFVDRQLEIILKLSNDRCVPIENITFLVNAIILITRLKAHGVRALLDTQDRMLSKEYILDFIGR